MPKLSIYAKRFRGKTADLLKAILQDDENAKAQARKALYEIYQQALADYDVFLEFSDLDKLEVPIQQKIHQVSIFEVELNILRLGTYVDGYLGGWIKEQSLEDAIKAKKVDRVKKIIESLAKIIDEFTRNRKLYFFLDNKPFPPIQDFLNNEFIALPGKFGMERPTYNSPYFTAMECLSKIPPDFAETIKGKKPASGLEGYLQRWESSNDLWRCSTDSKIWGEMLVLFHQKGANFQDLAIYFLMELIFIPSDGKYERFSKYFRNALQWMRILNLEVDPVSKEMIMKNFLDRFHLYPHARLIDIFETMLKEWGLPVFGVPDYRETLKFDSSSLVPVQQAAEARKLLDERIKDLPNTKIKTPISECLMQFGFNESVAQLVEGYARPWFAISHEIKETNNAQQSGPAEVKELKLSDINGVATSHVVESKSDNISLSVNALVNANGAGSPVNAGVQQTTVFDLSLDHLDLGSKDQASDFSLTRN